MTDEPKPPIPERIDVEAVNVPPTRSRGFVDDADVTAVAAMLAVYFSHVVTRRAVVDTPVQHVLYEVVTVTLMLVIAYRSKLAGLSMSFAPISLRNVGPPRRSARTISALVITAFTISLTNVARETGRVTTAFGYSPASGCEEAAGSSCCTYNDAACSGDSVVVDLIEVFTASIGEELAFRYAFLVIVARVAGVRLAVALQAIVWGLSHTGFDRGYGADVVVGLIAVGVVSAIAVLAARSVWPAIAAHALHSLAVTADDHDLTAVVWVVTATSVLSAVVCAAIVSVVAVRFVSRPG